MARHRKKQALHAWRNRQRADARAALPLPPAELKAMFDTLDVEVPRYGCDHSRRLTRAWLVQCGHNVEAVFNWLDQNDGFCDCEILANCEQAFEEAMHDAN